MTCGNPTHAGGNPLFLCQSNWHIFHVNYTPLLCDYPSITTTMVLIHYDISHGTAPWKSLVSTWNAWPTVLSTIRPRVKEQTRVPSRPGFSCSPNKSS
jgi:hypothetical protein